MYIHALYISIFKSLCVFDSDMHTFNRIGVYTMYTHTFKYIK